MRVSRWAVVGLLLSTCQTGTMIMPMCVMDSDCGIAGACHSGGCITCSTCGAGTTCLRAQCLPTACGAKTCANGQACLNGICNAADCVDVTCAAGEACASGQCLPLACSGVTCPDGFVCQANACVASVCVGVVCPMGELCAGGTCLSQACGTQTCPSGQVCVGGVCVDGACIGVVCPSPTFCSGGACVSAPDAGVMDSGMPLDAGATDSGVEDSGVPDGGPFDAGPVDAGVVDAGPYDDGGRYQTTLQQMTPHLEQNAINWMVSAQFKAIIDGDAGTFVLKTNLSATGSGMPPAGTLGDGVLITRPLPDGGAMTVNMQRQFRACAYGSYMDTITLPLAVGHYTLDADGQLLMTFDANLTNGRVENVQLMDPSMALDLTGDVTVTEVPEP